MGRNLLFVLIFQLLWPWATYAPAYAQEVPVAEASAPNLDLSSTERTVSAATVLPDGQATINLAGIARTISPTDMLTAAEMVAVRQVLNTGNQYLQLNDVGAAIGGGLHLQYYATNGLGNLVIPEGVRASQNAAMLQSLNLTGNLTNSGTLNIFSSNAAITSATINAANVYNNVGATISSTLANLNLNAVNNIVNAGTIMSAGNLSMTAGGSITNAGVLAVMQAANNLSLQAASIVNQGQMMAQLGNVNALTAQMTNSGIMQSLAGNVNIHNLLGTQLSVGGMLGNISAAHQVNLSTLPTVKDLAGNVVSKGLINVSGNTLAAQEINFSSPEGIVNVSADRLNGPVNVSAGIAYVGAKQGNLSIGSMYLTGDPIYYAQSGDLDLSGLFSGGSTFSTSGGDFVALASGNITATTAPSDALIDTTPNSSFGSITIVAGVDFTVDGGASPITCNDCAPLYEITGTSSSGGNIDLPTVDLKTSHHLSFPNVTLHLEARDDGSLTKGNIAVDNIENLGREHDSGSFIGYQPIYTTIVAAGDVTTGGIDSSGMQGTPEQHNAPMGGQGGGITISSSYGYIDILGNISAAGGGGAGGNTNTGSGGNGGLVRITALQGAIFVDGSINTYGGGGAGGQHNAGNGGDGGGVTLMASNDSITVNGAINSSGGGGGGSVTNPGDGGSAGNISLFTTSTISIAGPVLAAGGGDGGSGRGGGGGSFGGGGGAGKDSTTSGSGGGAFGEGGAGGAGGGGLYGGGSGASGSGSTSWGGSGGGSEGGQGGLTGGSQTGNDGSFGFGGNGTSPGNPGDDAGLSRGGTISLSGAFVEVTETIDSAFGFSTSPFAAYSIYAGGGGTVAISTPTALLPNGNFSSTDSTPAFLGSSSFTVGGSGSAGSINADNGIYINRVNVGTDVSSGTTAAASSSITIQKNGGPTVINDTDPVTPAEWLAIVQEVHGGQTATIDASGVMTAGSLDINALNYPGAGFSELVIPLNVTATSDVFSIKVTGSLLLDGFFTGNGSIYNIFDLNGLSVFGTVFGTSAPVLIIYIAGALDNYGTIGALSNINVSQTGDLTISGGGSFSTNAGSINFFPVSYPALLTFSDDQTFDPGTGGSVTLSTSSLTIGNGATLTVAEGASATFGTQQLTFEDNSTISALSSSTNLTFQVASATITLPTGSEATIETAGGTITFDNFGFSTLTFAKSSPTGTATLNLNGGDSFINGDPITAQAGCVFCTDSTITIDNSGVISTIDNDCGIIAYQLTSLDLVNDPSAVAAIIELQGYGYLGGTLIESGGVATGGNVIITPNNLAATLTAYNIPDNVTVTMQDFTDSDEVSIDITNTSTSSQAILEGTFEFTGTNIDPFFSVTSTEVGPVLVIEQDGIFSSIANSSITAESITNSGSIISTGNGTITLVTDNLVNDDVFSSIDAGISGSVIINPLNAIDVSVGGTTHSGVSLDITQADLANIGARNLTIGDQFQTQAQTLAGNIDVAGLYNLTLLSYASFDASGYSITVGFNTLNIETQGDASTSGIFGSGTTIQVTAGGTLTVNGTIEATDPNNAFSINGTITLRGSPVIINLDPGDEINAGQQTGIVNINPTSAMDIFLNAASHSGSNFDITSSDLEHITALTLNIGDNTNTSNIILVDDFGLNFNMDFGILNLTAQGSYDYNGNDFDWASRSGSITAGGDIDLGLMSNGGNYFVGQAVGVLSLNGAIGSFLDVTLSGSPVMLNGNSIDASDTVILRPNTSMSVNVGGVSASGTTFDITATDLANITAVTLIIGDAINADSLTVQGNLDISGAANNPGSYNLTLTSNGSFSSAGQTITIGREEFDNTNTLTVTTFGNATLGEVNTLATTSGILLVTAAGSVNLTTDIDVADGPTDGRIELKGSPVQLNGNSLNAGGSGFVSLAPTSDTNVAIADALGTAAPFDISATDLANITTGTLQIGDIYHTLLLTVEDNMDISGSGAGAYNLVLISSSTIDRTGITITIDNANPLLSKNIGLSTNGGFSNLATGDLDIAYLFDGSGNWRPAMDGVPENFVLNTGGSSSAYLGGWIDMGSDGGNISILAGGDFTYNPSGAVITFSGSGASATGGVVGLDTVNFKTTGNISIEAPANLGYVITGALNAIGPTSAVTITADWFISVGSFQTSRITGDLTVSTASSIGLDGFFYADNFNLQSSGFNLNGYLYANNTIDIDTGGLGNVNFSALNGLGVVEAPTITVNGVNITVDSNVQLVTPVNLNVAGSITITASTLVDNGLIAALGTNATLTIQAPAASALTINGSASDRGRLVVDPSGLITLSSADGQVQVNQIEITGTVSGTAQDSFSLEAISGLLTLGDISSTTSTIQIFSNSDVHIAAGSTIQADSHVLFESFATSSRDISLLISGTSINSTSGNVQFTDYHYVKNDSAISGVNIVFQNTDDADMIVTGNGSLDATDISFSSAAGSVIATQNIMDGNVGALAADLIYLSVLNPAGFVAGTMTSTAYGAASVPSGFSNLYVAAPAPISISNDVIGITTGSFSTFTLSSGTLTVAGTGNMIVSVRDSVVTDIDGISTSGGNLYFDSLPTVAGLIFNGDIDTRAASGDGGYVVLNSGDTIETEAILTSGTADGNGGAVKLLAPGSITVHDYLDSHGDESGSGGSVMVISETSNITFDTVDIININAIGGSQVDSLGNGGNITISAGGNVQLTGYLDSSAESSITNGSRADAGWIQIVADSITSTSSIRANGGNSGSSANEGSGGSVTLVATDTISVGAFLDTAGLGGGFGGDVTIHAGGAVNVVSINTTAGAQAVSNEIDGGYIVIQSDASTITASSFLDSSASFYANLDGGGNAGMIFVVSPGSVSVGSMRAEGRTKPGNETSDLLGNGNNVRVETGGNATLGFISSSAQSNVATRFGEAANAGRIDVIAVGDIIADTFKSTGGLGGGNGGDINITSTGGNISTSFIFTTALGDETFYEGAAYGNGGNINVSAASNGTTVSIGSFIDTSGSLDLGNAGSVTIIGDGGISSSSYIAANGGFAGGNGGDITLSAVGNGATIDFAFSLDSAGRLAGSGGLINLQANSNISATIVSANGGTASGQGGDIVIQVNGNITISEASSITSQDGIAGASNGGNIFLNAPEGEIAVLGNINTSAGGISSDAGDITILFASGVDFTIDSSANIINGVRGSIQASAAGSGNGGAVTIVNEGGDLNVNVNELIDVSSESGLAGAINFNYAQLGAVVEANTASNVTVTGLGSEWLLGPINASGPSITFTMASSNYMSLATLHATAGSISVTMPDGAGLLEVLDNGVLVATEGNISLLHNNTSSGLIYLGSSATLSAITSGTTFGKVYISIGAPTPVAGTTPANMVVDVQNGGQVYFGNNGITSNAPDNHANADGGEIVFDTGSLSNTAIQLDGDVTINAFAGSTPGGPIYSLDFTDPDLTALIISLQNSSDVGGTLQVNEDGVAIGGNAIISFDMLATTLTSTNIPTGVTITFDAFSLSDEVNVSITEDSYSNVAIIAGTLEFDGGGSPSAGVINIISDQASASGNPAFSLTNTGSLISDGSLSLSASGRLIIEGTVTAATDLTLSTTANNGNINITGTVTATESATLSTNGNGTVTGTVDTPTLNFSSTMGNLGTSGSRFVTNSDSLGISTGGDAYINNTSTGTLNLGTIAARNFDLINDHAVVLSSTLQATQSALIVVTGDNGGVTLNGNFTAPNWMALVAHGTGDIVQNGGTIRSSSLYLSTGSGDIGSSGNPIQTNAFYTTFITSGGEVHINSSNSVRVHNPSSGSTVDITSNGQIEVAQPINSTGSVTFHGAGSIILSADITATSFVSLYGNGHGNIINNGGSIITPTLTTETSTGVIGTENAPIETTADDITSSNTSDFFIATSATPTSFNVSAGYVGLTLNIDGDLGSSGSPYNTSVNQLTLNVIGSAYVNTATSLILGNSTVRDTVQITTGNNLTVNDLVTTTGSITLISNSGALTINSGSTVQANEGNVTLQNNSATGSIFVGNGSTVKGFTVDNPSFGNVTMTVGSSVGTSGTAPGNVTENIVGDGQIIIGNNGFTSNNSGNTLDALDRTITIDAGATGSIILDGDVLISADPPMPQVTAPSEIANILPLLSITANTPANSNSLGASTLRVQPVVLDTTLTPHQLNIDTTQTNIINFNTAPAEPETSEEPVYKPIAYTTTSAPSAATIVNSSRELSQTNFGTCDVRHSGLANVSYSEGNVNLHSGEILVNSPRHTSVKSGDYSVSIDPDSVVLITKEGSVTKVRALHESHMNAIVLTSGNSQIKVSAGQEVMVAPHSTHLQVAIQKDGLGRRHIRDAELPNGHAMTRSEFSHMTLIEQSSVLTKLVQSKSPADKQLANKLIKTAACLMTVTGAHGAYSGK